MLVSCLEHQFSYSMRIYKYSIRFRVPASAVDQSDHSILLLLGSTCTCKLGVSYVHFRGLLGIVSVLSVRVISNAKTITSTVF